VQENGIITWANSIERVKHALLLLRAFLVSPTNLSALSSALSHGGYPGCIGFNSYTDFLSGSCCSFFVQIFSNFPRSVSGSKHNCDNRRDLALVYGVYLLGFLDIYSIMKDFRDCYHKKKINISHFSR